MKRLITAAALMLTAALSSYAAETAMTVYKDPNCGCCAKWIEYMEKEGFSVKAVDTADLSAVKQRLGVPGKLSSCHTAVVHESGQIIEGHVPVRAVRKMLADRAVKGVAAPGMPVNSPGMGKLNGKLVTVDFEGKPFSKD